MLKRKKLLAFLFVLIILLLAGCAPNRYPKDMPAMKKLFEENTEEFQKFADNLLLQIEEGESLEIVFIPSIARRGYHYGYKIVKVREETPLEPISNLQNGKEISDFIAKYGVFTASAGGYGVSFDIFPLDIAETSGQGTGYKTENFKDIRNYSYQPNETDEEATYWRTHNTELKEHWYANVDPFATESGPVEDLLSFKKETLKAEGYLEINPIITSVPLPFLPQRNKQSYSGNREVDYIFEIDETKIVFFYEHEKKITTALFNWEAEEIIETFTFSNVASPSGVYHVERIGLDLFAFSDETPPGTPQLVSILKIEPNKITEIGIIALPNDVKFSDCSAGISPDLKYVVMAHSDPARLTVAMLDDSLILDKKAELNATAMAIGERATIDNVKFISEDVVAYSWTANNDDKETRYSGIGLYSISKAEIILDYPFNSEAMIQVGNGVLVSDANPYGKKKFIEDHSFTRYITEDGALAFGEALFNGRYEYCVTSYMGDQMFTPVNGRKSENEPWCFVRFSFTDKTWDKELWNVPDSMLERNSRTKNRTHFIATAGITSKSIYFLSLEDQKPMLTIVQHPNP